MSWQQTQNMQEYPYTTKEFRTWKKFKLFIDKLSENWIFRGQSDASWDLQTSLERTKFYKKYDGIETSFLTDFQRGAKNFLGEVEIPENLIEWLALMQHHGAPTRLLDFTKSAYTASFFAFEHIDEKVKKVAVWAIHIDIIANATIGHLYFQFQEDFKKNHRRLTEEIFEKLFFGNDQSCILPVEPFRMNKRYYLQQSVFVSPANSIDPFMEQLDFLEQEKQKVVLKITLPAGLQNEVLLDLQKMNINRATLFPDLDGYAASLKMKYNTMRNFDEHIKYQLDEIEFLKKEILIIDEK